MFVTFLSSTILFLVTINLEQTARLVSLRANVFFLLLSYPSELWLCALFCSLILVSYKLSLSSCFANISGADIVGVNCRFDHNMSLKTIGLMKEALDKEGLSPHLMVQPVGYLTPDAGPFGWVSLPEVPLGNKS